MNPIWIQSVTIDRLNQFDAVRDTAIGIGSVTLYRTSRAVPFQFADLVDPLQAPVKLAPPYPFPYQMRDKTSYWFGLSQSRIPHRVQCARGMWSFDPPRHAIQFVEENAMDWDRSKRTALAEAILRANAKFNESFDRNVVGLANVNARRLMNEMETSAQQK